MAKLRDDPTKNFAIITPDEQQAKREVAIPGCGAVHMNCFHPDGAIAAKQNICSCEGCIVGDFVSCIDEPGYMCSGQTIGNVLNDEEEELDEYGDEIDESVIEVVKTGDIIALFSPKNSLELFFLCRIL